MYSSRMTYGVSRQLRCLYSYEGHVLAEEAAGIDAGAINYLRRLRWGKPSPRSRTIWSPRSGASSKETLWAPTDDDRLLLLPPPGDAPRSYSAQFAGCLVAIIAEGYLEQQSEGRRGTRISLESEDETSETYLTKLMLRAFNARPLARRNTTAHGIDDPGSWADKVSALETVDKYIGDRHADGCEVVQQSVQLSTATTKKDGGTGCELYRDYPMLGIRRPPTPERKRVTMNIFGCMLRAPPP
ncbi:hypothetical protein O1611_g2958 [Lasiodiplodia mahajangana]|uniref:Uncharacterized protein n=1 Tax=Lasiodiplodia mahajangana TaxID=1108764 RepID=A0ACC2JT29_9PEZI|nr:hypothetical protein O1611_g2958 [Lasiodiplodia mahajangana]